MNRILTMALCGAVALTASAVPAKRGLRPVTQADGSVIMIERVGDESRNFTLNSDGALLRQVDGMYRLADIDEQGILTDASAPVLWSSDRVQNTIAMLDEVQPMQRANAVGLMPNRYFPCTGVQKAIVILVQYQDVKFTLDDPYTYFNDMLNKQGFSDPKYGGTGSCRDYFVEASMGQFLPEFDVYGPITLKYNRSYYGGNNGTSVDSNPRFMAIEAVQQLDATVDFRQYDRDNNGVIDNVFLFYAGQGEASYGPDESVWPHASSVGGSYYFDGVRLSSYGCTNEWEQTRPDGIGTFCHEFSHVMGVPDLYHTVAQTAYTPGAWSVMDYGPYNNDGRTPPTYSSFERNALKWIDLKEIQPGQEINVPVLRTSNEAYCRTNPSNPNEFYLFENRLREGSDKYIPGDGMLVWHIHYVASQFQANTVNCNNDHQYVDLVEADGIAAKTNRNGGDAFPGTTKKTRLFPKWWSGKNTGIIVRNITENEDHTISFNVETAPEANGEFYTVEDVICSNGDADVANAKVQGYIVGFSKSGNYSRTNATFSTEKAVKTNILLADRPDETDWCNCIPVQLSSGTDARNELNLAENPGMLGAKVEVYGTISAYVGARGVRAVGEYTLLTEAGLDEIEALDPAEGPAEWYTIQGVKVAAPATPGVYLRRTATSTVKVLVK